jgi:hypothetical protein
MQIKALLWVNEGYSSDDYLFCGFTALGLGGIALALWLVVA